MTLLGGRYRLVEQLGVGGMSVVWRGFDEVLGRQVAVKVLDGKLASDPAFRRRIRIEARAAARLCHPHITNVYDYGQSDDTPYVVMELVDGEPLADVLARDGVLPWQTAVTVCGEVASALAAAHQRGIVHRDVKPANVMLTEAGAKVVDFGLSALIGESDVGPDGNLLGTPAYLAPERLDGGAVSPAADVYGLGLLLYRALTGQRPWHVASMTDMLRAHRYAEPIPLPPVDGLPAEVAELCERCLAKDPDERPTSAEVADALAVNTARPHLDDTAILPLPADPTDLIPAKAGGFRRRAQAALVGAVLMAATGLLWANAARSPGSGPGGAGGAAAAAAPTPPSVSPAGAPACRVRYAVRQDSGSTFQADVTVTNAGREPVAGWRLTFAFPGDQEVAESAQVVQAGRRVSARGDTIPAGGSATLGLTGRYAEANPAPVGFMLDGQACETSVADLSAPPPTAASATGEKDNSGSGSGKSNGNKDKGNKGKGDKGKG
ncbi:serine/threonine-protein kinase [Micromonospora sp. CPCC 206061]|uniref:serine/threonine-protein kinase n=1 Tax=Micromonospora sp. CPCC 206061 TaxID=3122410 RepID=UPI002FF066D3